MNKSEALRLALEALEMSRRFVYADNRPQCDEAIDALRAALAQQDAPVREPVQEPEGLDWRYTARIGYVVKPYTAPPQRKPLTQEEIDGLVIQHAGYGRDNFYAVARAVERAHGIKE